MTAQQSHVLYLCPADDLAIGFEFGAMEDFDTGDGLHGLPINGTDDTEKPKQNKKTVC